MAQKVAPKEINFDTALPLAIDSASSTREFVPENGATFAYGNNRVIRIPLRSEDLLDTRHSYLRFKVVAGQTQALDQTAYALISRLRILSGGVPIEDIGGYNVLANLLIKHQSGKGYMESYGAVAMGATANSAVPAHGAANGQNRTADTESRYFCLPLFSGIMNNNKYIPLPLLNSVGLTIELTLEDPNSAVLAGADDPTCTISDVAYVAQMVKVSPDVIEGLRAVQMSTPNQSIMIAGQTWKNYKNSISANAGSAVLNIPDRSGSLKALFSVLRQTAAIGSRTALSLQFDSGQVTSYVYKIGSKMYPQSKINVNVTDATARYAEVVTELHKAFGKLGDYSHHALVNNTTWIKNGDNAALGDFCMAIDVEGFAQADVIESGIDTQRLALPVSLEIQKTAVNAAYDCDTFALCDAVFFCGADGQMTSST